MPYSKNPYKYPPEMLQLLEHLRQRPEGDIRIPCATAQEANSRKVMIQSFFKAVELHAEEQARVLVNLRAKASSAAERRDRAAADTAADYTTAKAVGETWEDRAYVARQWMVRAEQLPPVVVVVRRNVDGAFGDNLRAMLAGTAPALTDDTPAPPPADSLEAQLELLRLASAQLQAGGTKTD